MFRRHRERVTPEHLRGSREKVPRPRGGCRLLNSSTRSDRPAAVPLPPIPAFAPCNTSNHQPQCGDTRRDRPGRPDATYAGLPVR